MRFIPRWVRSFAVGLIVIWLLQAFVVKVYYIPSQSMEPTLSSQSGAQDRILVNRTWIANGKISSGDIIVFQRDSSWDGLQVETNPSFLRQLSEVFGLGPGLGNKVVKRAIATGGQKASCCNSGGQILVNGEPIILPTKDWDFELGTLDCNTSPKSRRCFDEVTVPENSYLVLGDNRVNSSDSLSKCVSGTNQTKCVRFVSSHQVIGKVVAIVWPLVRLHIF